MTAHPNAHILAQLAEIAKTDPEPWKRLEVQVGNGWLNCNEFTTPLNPNVAFRIKPATVKLGGVELEGPLREAKTEQSVTDARVTLPDDIERMAVNRYRPVPAGVLAYKVVGGDGDRSLFSGTKDECQIVARKLTEAFLDGAHVALAAKAETADASDGRWYALVKLANGETK